jgi:tRNA A37 threonylcarbamoyladenosine dehydratase
MNEGLITDEKYIRFKDADWFSNTPISVMVAGVGGTGSWSAMLLARAGFNPICFDADSYERVNLCGQLVSKQQIGKTKVSAIAETIQNYCDMSIITFNEKVNENTMTNNYIFSCFDNMKSRKILFENWEKNNFEDGLLVDLRLSAERLQIFCVTKEGGDVDAKVTAVNATGG